MKLCAAILLLLTISCTNKNQTVEKITTNNSPKLVKICEDHQYCAPLRNFEEKCRLKSLAADCAQFVEHFEKLSVKNNCQRSFDTAPVPSVWICDQDTEEAAEPKLFERSATTLSKLKFDFAKKFYASEKFRSTLDGEVAEEHYKHSLLLSKTLNVTDSVEALKP